MGWICKCKGGFTDGPYEIRNPDAFFKNDFYSHGFNPEVDSVRMAVAYTIRARMSQEGWQIPLFKQLPSGYVEEVPTRYGNIVNTFPIQSQKKKKNVDQIELYGTPKDLDDFCLEVK